MIYVVELSFPTQSRSLPELIKKKAPCIRTGLFSWEAAGSSPARSATGTCRGKRWRSDRRCGQTIVKRGLTVVKRSLVTKKHLIHVVPECLYRGSSVFESGL